MLQLFSSSFWHPAVLSAAMQHERLSFTPHSNNLYGLLISHFRGFLGHDSRVPGFNSSMYYRRRLARRSLCSSIPIQQKTVLSRPTSSWGLSSKSSLSEEVHIPARRYVRWLFCPTHATQEGGTLPSERKNAHFRVVFSPFSVYN